MTTQTIINKAIPIRCLLCDVDGVLTDGHLYYGIDGEQLKVFHVHDGFGLKLLMNNGIDVGIITSRESPMVATRLEELGVQLVYQGQQNKISALETILDQLSLNPTQIAYIGDDLPDLPLIRRVGLSVAVANAVAPIKQQADWITKKKGGHGAVREAAEFILKAQQKDAAIVESFL